MFFVFANSQNRSESHTLLVTLILYLSNNKPAIPKVDK